MNRVLGCPRLVLDGNCGSTWGQGTPHLEGPMVAPAPRATCCPLTVTASPQGPWLPHRAPEPPRAEGADTGCLRPAAQCSHWAMQGSSPLASPPHTLSAADAGRRCPQSDPLFRRVLHSTDTHPLPMHSPPSPTPRGLHRERLGGHREPPGGRGGQSQPAPRPRPASPGDPQGPALLPRGARHGAAARVQSAARPRPGSAPIN